MHLSCRIVIVVMLLWLAPPARSEEPLPASPAPAVAAEEPNAPVPPPSAAAEPPAPVAAPATGAAAPKGLPPEGSPPAPASPPPLAEATTPALPEPTTPSPGCEQLRQGASTAAVKLLQEELLVRPGSPELNFCLGAAQNRLSQREAALALKRALREEPENPAVNYELGLYYYRQGVDAEAADYFETVVDLAPTGPYVAAANDYLRRIAARGQQKPWLLEVRLGGQYDSNVILHGDNQAPLPNWLGPADWRGVAQLRGALFPYRSESTQVSLAYGFYQSAHHNLSEFNVTQHQAEAAVSRKLSDSVSVSVAGAYEYLLLGSVTYDRARQLMPALSWRFGRAGVSVLAWRWRTVDYDDSRRFSANSRYDGQQNTYSWSHLVPLNQRLALLAGYARIDEGARASWSSFSADRGQVGVRVQLPLAVQAELSGEFQRRRYDGVDPAFLRRRSDDQRSYSVTLTRPLSQRTSLVLGQQLVYNRSNFSPYAYDRSLSSLFVTARF